MIKTINSILSFVKQEANETKISAKILIKLIRNKKVSKKEITFLRDHTTDLIKIVGFIITGPTPIPYLELTIILRKFGINLLPKKEPLDIP